MLVRTLHKVGEHMPVVRAGHTVSSLWMQCMGMGRQAMTHMACGMPWHSGTTWHGMT